MPRSYGVEPIEISKRYILYGVKGIENSLCAAERNVAPPKENYVILAFSVGQCVQKILFSD